MIVILHILIALGSILFATSALVRPTKTMLSASYVAIAATLASGIVLTLSNPTHLAQACLSGLVYIAIVATITVFAKKRLHNI